MANLKWGSTGKPVEQLQSQLNKTKIAGPKLKVDGIFGPKTYEGVKTFQKKEKVSKLKVDGVFGPKTKTALQNFLNPKKSGGVDPKELKKKIEVAAKNLAGYTKYLMQMGKYLELIQKQKKTTGQSAQKEIDKMSRKVRELQYMSDQAASSCDGAWTCAAGGTVSQNYQIDAHNLKIDLNQLKSVKDENQKDFDRRIKDAQKRIDIAQKAIKKTKGDLTKLQKQAAN